MTHRVSPGGSFRIDRRFRGVGRIAIASGTANKATFAKLNVMLTELYEDGRLDILRALRDRQWTLQEIYEAKRVGTLPYLASELVIRRSLWDAVDQWVQRSAKAESSRKRYGTSFASLKRSGVLAEAATVADLRQVHWAALQAVWSGGPADWNRLRAAVSRFLSMNLGDKHHPFRRAVMHAFPRAKEPAGRVPDLSTDLFWKIVAKVPEYVKPCYVALAVTGLRVGEYLALEPHHLRPHTRAIQVPGTKTAASQDVIQVGLTGWEWVQAAVPSPIKYKWLYTHWKRACRACGAPELTLHDLRHFCGQSLTNAGRPEVSVQHQLRHANPGMTRRYTRQRDRGENALLLDEILFGAR